MKSLNELFKSIPRKAAEAVSIASLASILLLPKTAGAEGSVEMVFGDDKANLETTVYGDVSEDFNVYLWSIISMDDGDVYPFSNMSLRYELDDLEASNDSIGINLLMILQAYDNDFVPRLGMDYVVLLEDDLDFYHSIAPSLIHPELELISGVLYHPNLSAMPWTNEEEGRIQAESINYFGLDGHIFSAQRFRVGARDGNLSRGFSLDLEEYGDDFDFNYNLGAYLSLEFE